MPLAIANRYAQALGEVVSQPGSLVGPEAALQQLEAFQQLLAESADLNTVLASPAVAPAKKRALVARLGERLGLPVPVRNFLFVVIDHRRMEVLPEIIRALRGWLDQKLGIARLDVLGARALDLAQQASVEQAFERLTGKQVRANYGVDPELLGGAVVRHGSVLYDGSLRAQLQALKQALVQGF
jgi:F-type H+-transporting ATPase subunit delta